MPSIARAVSFPGVLLRAAQPTSLRLSQRPSELRVYARDLGEWTWSFFGSCSAFTEDNSFFSASPR